MTSFWYAELMYFGLSFVANYYNNMGLIINHHNESIQFSRLKNLVTHGDTIRIISSDRVTMNVSKFMLTFFGDIFQHDQDCIITPIESSILNGIVDMLNLKNVELKDVEYYQLLGLDTKGLESVSEILNLKIGQNVKIKKAKSVDVLEEGGFSPISNLFCEIPSFKKVISIKHYADKYSEIQTSLQDKANEQSKDEELPIRAAVQKDDANVYKDQETELAVQKDDDEFCKPGKENKCQSNENGSLTEASSNVKANNRKEQNRGKRIKTKKLNKSYKYKDNTFGDPILIKNGTKIITVECRLCGKVFDRKQYSKNSRGCPYHHYKTHFLRHHILTTKCCDYDLTGETKAQKRKHFFIVHRGFLGCTENENCPKAFRTEEALKDHAKLHKSTNDKCDKCDFTSPYPLHLRYHKEKVHNLTKNPLLKVKTEETFVCSECNKPLPSEKRLIYHKSEYHNLQECKECGKEFIGHRSMKRHTARFHCEESFRFHCDRCGKRFFNTTYLKDHIDSIHLGVVFNCRYPICDKKLQPYRNKGNRDSHERKRHGQNYNVFLRQKESPNNIN